MTDAHLDSDTVRRLLAGDLAPADARRWAAHLDRDCEACEAALAAGPVGPLDGLADAALARMAPRRDSRDEGNDLELARIKRALRPARAVPRRFVAYLAAAAAVLAGSGVAIRAARAPRTAWDGVKGPAAAAAAIPARLRFVVVGAAAQGEARRGASGDVLPPEASVLFRIEAGAPAYVGLVRAGGGELEVVHQQRLERPGAADVAVGGAPAAYALKGLSGTQRFVLVASASPLGVEELRQAARAATSPAATAQAPRALGVDVVEITVR